MNKAVSFHFIFTLLHISPLVWADPDAIQDFCIAINSSIPLNGFPCKPNANVNSDDFFFSGLSKKGNTSNKLGSTVTPANVLTFHGVNTLGISMNRVDLMVDGLNPPHSHPRATEMVLVAKGTVLVGFISSSDNGNRFFSKVLKVGELFVIPPGVVHFQKNKGKKNAVVFTAFNSQLPSVVNLATTLFSSNPNIPPDVLTETFNVDQGVIKKIIQGVDIAFGS